MRGLPAPPEGSHVAGDRVAVARATGAAHGLLVWHRCSAEDDRWVPSGAGLHSADLSGGLEQITMHPSLYFSDCCWLHGWLTDGRWVPA